MNFAGVQDMCVLAKELERQVAKPSSGCGELMQDA